MMMMSMSMSMNMSKSTVLLLLRSRPVSATSVRLLSATTATATTSAALKESYEHVQVERQPAGVGLIRLHRPQALNALSDALFQDLMHAATALDQDESIGCLVLTGSSKAFAAGADIAEMKDRTFAFTYQKNMFAEWADFTRVSKPVIAAVNGFCLGGGCELVRSYYCSRG